ncbi:jg23559 [Pararge aegeria aegeria]|uniref:Jg23559 protein n=1 Tax=Pararge aegeria aegeria TaxID=348720 RepID=A0A8S4RXJ1_9NEOP|nr:jg23559 [Pararge aegeria aegeria]
MMIKKKEIIKCTVQFLLLFAEFSKLNSMFIAILQSKACFYPMLYLILSCHMVCSGVNQSDLRVILDRITAPEPAATGPGRPLDERNIANMLKCIYGMWVELKGSL